MTELPEPSDLGFDLDDAAWLRQAQAALKPQSWDNLGDYKILEEVSRGGQGVVLRATNLDGQMVAIKRLLGGSLTGTHGRLRFEREMEIAARLDHPNIVPLLSREIVDRQPLLVMPWIDGLPPDRWAHPVSGLKRNRRQIVQLMIGICEAVGHAHQRGVIHRDLKPSNILVDKHGQPHVLDFGIGKLLLEDAAHGQDLTRTTEFLGSPTYAPPERLLSSGAPADVRDDVYSLGVLLYGLLTNAEPYPFGDTLASAIRALQENEPTPIRRFAPNLERDLAVVVHKAIAKESSQRYASVEAFRADLLRFLNGDAVLAHPPSRLYGLRKFAQRNPLATALSALSVGLILGFGFYAQRQAQHLKVERNAAIDARSDAAAAADRTRDALGFLIEEVLAQLDPGLRGRVASVPEILRDASSDLADRFGSDPDLEIEIRMAIGRMQLLNGDYTGASSQFDRAITLLPMAQESDLLAAQQSQRDLALMSAKANLIQAKFPQAEAQLERAAGFLLPISTITTTTEDASSQDHDKQRLTLLRIQLALAKGQMDVAEATCRAALASLEEAEPSLAQQGHHWRNQLLLVLILRSSGRAPQAVELAASLVEQAQQRHPKEAHIDIADAKREWGWSMFYAGQLVEAETPLREALQLRRQLLGPMNPAVAQSLMDIATWSQLFGKDPEVIRAQFEEAVAILRGSGSGQQQLIAGAWSGLAGLAADSGELERAEQLYREALQVLTLRFGENHPLLADLYLDLGMLQTQREQFDAARASLQRAQALRENRNRNAGGHRDAPTLLMAMARNEEAAGALEVAVGLFRRAADTLIEEVPAGCTPLLVCLNSLERLHEQLDHPDASLLARQEAQKWSVKMAAARANGG